MRKTKRKMGLVALETCCPKALLVADKLREIIEKEGYEVVNSSNVNDLVGLKKGIMLIDAVDDTDNLGYTVERMYEIFEDPIYVIVNFEDVSKEDRPYLEGIIPNILVDRDLVKEISNAEYEVIFFSSNGGDRAFRDVILESDTNNTNALKNLL